MCTPCPKVLFYIHIRARPRWLFKYKWLSGKIFDFIIIVKSYRQLVNVDDLLDIYIKRVNICGNVRRTRVHMNPLNALYAPRDIDEKQILWPTRRDNVLFQTIISVWYTYIHRHRDTFDVITHYDIDFENIWHHRRYKTSLALYIGWITLKTTVHVYIDIPLNHVDSQFHFGDQIASHQSVYRILYVWI